MESITYFYNKEHIKNFYFNIKKECDLPIARLFYTYIDFNKIIQIGDSICIHLKEDKKNIELMTELSTRAGFMFFNNSVEGRKWFKENPIKIDFDD